MAQFQAIQIVLVQGHLCLPYSDSVYKPQVSIASFLGKKGVFDSQKVRYKFTLASTLNFLDADFQATEQV